ncbi:MAG: DUF4249 domain-containing protein [Tannerella sp.]|jgi:hypothetical protein|nr:DUF4249 domain-containing protein [Tannerella sp.]
MFTSISRFIFPILLLSACTAPIDIDTRDSEPVIVIYGCLTDENRYQSVRITSSSPYFDSSENAAVTDATVRISDSKGRDHDLLHGEDGYYFSDSRFRAYPGVTYHLVVDVDFDGDGLAETYEATTTLRPALTVDSIAVKPISIMGFRHYALNIFTQDPPESQDFYLFRFFINDSISNSRISSYIVSDDEFFNGSYLENTIYYFDDATDENTAGRNREDDNAFLLSPGDRIRLQVSNMEEGYYRFINECTSEMRGGNPMFGGPPSNISTNVSNGAAGFFTGYCVRETVATVPDYTGFTHLK